MLRRFNTDYFNDTLVAYQIGVGSLPGTFLPNGQTDSNGNNCAWIGLSTTVPDEAGNNVTEPIGGGYVRQPLITIPVNGNFSCQFTKYAPGLYYNNVPVAWMGPSVAWAGPAVAVCVWDAKTSGHLLAVDASLDQTISDTFISQAPFIQAGGLIVGINPGWKRGGMISQKAADLFAAYCYTNASYSIPASIYAALLNSIPLPSDTGTITGASYEPNGNNYSRYNLSFFWHQVKPGIYGNSLVAAFALPTGTWSNRMVAWAAVDALTHGNMLYAGRLNPPKQFNPSNPAVFAQYGLQLGLGD